MSDCCLPNLGCLSIPVISTNVAGTSGQNGAPGAAATKAVGTVTTVNPGDPATVTNSGTTSAAIFDFEIPEGAVGATGVNGVSRLYTNLFSGTSTSIVTSNWESMATYTLAAGSLANVGDSVLISFETELLLPNITSTFLGITSPVPPLRRVSIASGATSLTRYGSTQFQEPIMTTLSNIAGNVFSYRTTVELIRVSSSSFSNNFMRRCRVDHTIPGQPYSYSNGAGSLLGINVNNPIEFSFDIYQFQSTEMRIKNATIDKITAVTP